MQITLTYQSSRADAMRQYLRLWTSTLWRFHLMFVISTMVVVWFVSDLWVKGHDRLLVAAVAGLLFLLFLLAFPMLVFRPEVRTLEADAQGLRTRIGAQGGSLAWRDVQAVEERPEGVNIVNRNLHAFLVPRSAIGDDAQVKRFVEALQAWQRAAA